MEIGLRVKRTSCRPTSHVGPALLGATPEKTQWSYMATAAALPMRRGRPPLGEGARPFLLSKDSPKVET